MTGFIKTKLIYIAFIVGQLAAQAARFFDIKISIGANSSGGVGVAPAAGAIKIHDNS